MVKKDARSDQAVIANDAVENQAVVKTLKLNRVETESSSIIRRGVIKGIKEVYLSPKAEGRVAKLYREVGDKVWRGQYLARIDGREYWAQDKVAQTGYQFADKTVSKTKKFFEAQIEQAKKARDLAEEAYKMYEKMGDQEKAAEAKANYEMAKKQVDVAKRAYDLQVKMAKGQRDVAQSQWEAARTVAGNTVLTAPFTGVIGKVMVEEGDLVSPQRPLFLLIDDSSKEVILSVESDYLDSLEKGQAVTVRTEDGKTFTAKIKAISPMVDTYTRKGEVKVELPKEKDLKLGEYVEVLLPQVAGKTGEILIPQAAVVQLYHDNFVFVVDGDKAKKVKVKLGPVVGDKVVIQAGLQGDETLVVEGQQYLHDGESVKVIAQ